MTVCSILFETNGLVLKKLLSQGQQNYHGGALGLVAKSDTPNIPTLRDISRGQTYEQIRQACGEPLYSLLTLDGGTARIWQTAATSGFTKVRVRELTIWFDESDIVTEFAVQERVE